MTTRQRGTPPPKPFGPLVPGWRYKVVRGFRDHDGIEHAPEKCWRFDRYTFLPQDDGLSLFVTRDDGRAGQIRLQARPETERPVAQSLEDYLLPVSRFPLSDIHLSRLRGPTIGHHTNH